MFLHLPDDREMVEKYTDQQMTTLGPRLSYATQAQLCKYTKSHAQEILAHIPQKQAHDLTRETNTATSKTDLHRP